MSKKDRLTCYIAAYSELLLYSTIPLLLLMYSLEIIDDVVKTALYIGLGIHVIIFVCWIIRSDKTFYFPPSNYLLLGKGGEFIKSFLLILSHLIFLYWFFTNPSL